MAHDYTTATHKLLTFTFPPLLISDRLKHPLLVVAFIILGLTIAWLPLVELALLLGGAILIILIVLKPIISLYLLIPLIPFGPWFAISVGGIRLGLREIVLVLGIIAWLLQLSVRKYSPSQNLENNFSRTKSLMWPFLIFLGGVSLSWLNTLSLGASLVETIKWIEMLAIYLLVVTLLPARHIKWVVLLLILTGVAQAALGLYQFIFKVGPEGFLLFNGRFLRAYGTFAQPNPYAGYLGLVLPLALSLVIWGLAEFEPDSRILSLVLFSLPLGLLLAALFASQSRGAWLGFTIAAGVTFAIYNRRTAVILALAILVGTTISMLGAFDSNIASLDASYEAVLQRLADAISIFKISDIAAVEVTDANFATVERLAHWQAAINMWRDNPWLGVGFGNYAVIYPAYAIGRWLSPLGHAHNYLLNIGAEAGLVGLIAYLIFWIFAFGVLWRVVRQGHGFDRAVATGGLGIMVHLHVHNLFDNLYVQGMYLHIAIILALVSIIYQHQKLSIVSLDHRYDHR